MHGSLCAAPGLRNLGNTCFLNTILQSLASLSLFIDYLRQVNGTNNLLMCNNEEDSFRSQCLTPLANSLLECLVGLSPAPINSINNQAAKVISSVTAFSNFAGTRDPSNFYRKLRLMERRFENGDQQDAQELLMVLLDLIDIEAAKANMQRPLDSGATKVHINNHQGEIVMMQRKGLSLGLRKPGGIRSCELGLKFLKNDNISGGACAQKASLNLSHQQQRRLFHLSPFPSTNPFRGSFTSELVCVKCTTSKPLKISPFVCLPLPLPLNNNPTSLKECLRLFSGPDMVHDVVCHTCAFQDEILRLTEQLRMAKRMHATHVETLQEHLEELKNALEGGNNLDNIVYSVTETTRRFIKRLWLSAIPRMELEVSEFCLFGQRKKETATYSLRSVVVHHGTSRCLNDNKWVHISDAHVQPVSVHEVLACEAYLLFYQR